MAPDFDRLARTPWPIASLASSGIRPFSSVLAFSCSRKAARVERNTPANSAQELEALMSTSSSCAIYGEPERMPISESTRLNPISPHGFTKLVCERMMDDFGRKYVVVHHHAASNAAICRRRQTTSGHRADIVDPTLMTLG